MCSYETLSTNENAGCKLQRDFGLLPFGFFIVTKAVCRLPSQCRFQTMRQDEKIRSEIERGTKRLQDHRAAKDARDNIKGKCESFSSCSHLPVRKVLRGFA